MTITSIDDEFCLVIMFDVPPKKCERNTEGTRNRGKRDLKVRYQGQKRG